MPSAAAHRSRARRLGEPAHRLTSAAASHSATIPRTPRTDAPMTRSVARAAPTSGIPTGTCTNSWQRPRQDDTWRSSRSAPAPERRATATLSRRGGRARRGSRGWLEDDLGVAVYPLVELVIGLRRLIETDIVGHHEARRGPAVNDHVAQLAVVPLDVGLAHAHALALLEELADLDEQHAPLGRLVDATRIGGHVQTGDADHARRADGLHQGVQHRGRGLALAGPRLGLVADGVDALVRALSAGLLLDLRDRVSLGEVDRDGADVACLG